MTAPVHADADEATCARELVTPRAPVAPSTMDSSSGPTLHRSRVSDERQPRGSIRRGWAIVFRQHRFDVLVDGDAERLGDDQRNP